MPETFPRNIGHKLCFDNWFTTLDLIHYLDKEGILSFSTYAQTAFKDVLLWQTRVCKNRLKKQPRHSLGYKIDNNNGICIVKWNNSTIVQLTSNFVAIPPIQKVLQCNKSSQLSRISQYCYAIYQEYG